MNSNPLEFDCEFEFKSGFRLSLNFVSEGLVTALVGPSGCGKSTVLNLIAGLLRPISGSIVVQGRTLFHSAKQISLAPECRNIGYAFQDYQLFPHLTVLQNLRYGERRSATKTVSLSHVVEVLQLTSLLKRYPNSLSGGQRQRVSLGRAVMCSPSLLLLDEPLSAVDQVHRAEVFAFVSKAIQELSIPTVLVSHDLESIGAIPHRVISMASPATNESHSP
jgi:molybdate transport system ATP-binding protein